jgi:hypothetical protein
MCALLAGCALFEKEEPPVNTTPPAPPPPKHTALYDMLTGNDFTGYVFGELKKGTDVDAVKLEYTFDSDTNSYYAKSQYKLIPSDVGDIEGYAMDNEGFVMMIDKSYSYKILIPIKISDSFLEIADEVKTVENQYVWNDLGLYELPLTVQMPKGLNMIASNVSLGVFKDEYSLVQSLTLATDDLSTYQYTLYFNAKLEDIQSQQGVYIAVRESSVKVGLFPYLYMRITENLDESAITGDSAVETANRQQADKDRVTAGGIEVFRGNYHMYDVFVRDHFWSDHVPNSTSKGSVFLKNVKQETSIYVYNEKQKYFEATVFKDKVISLDTNMDFKYNDLYYGMTYWDFAEVIWGTHEETDKKGNIKKVYDIPADYAKRKAGAVVMDYFKLKDDIGRITYRFAVVNKVDMLVSVKVELTDLWENIW